MWRWSEHISSCAKTRIADRWYQMNELGKQIWFLIVLFFSFNFISFYFFHSHDVGSYCSRMHAFTMHQRLIFLFMVEVKWKRWHAMCLLFCDCYPGNAMQCIILNVGMSGLIWFYFILFASFMQLLHRYISLIAFVCSKGLLDMGNIKIDHKTRNQNRDETAQTQTTKQELRN